MAKWILVVLTCLLAAPAGAAEGNPADPRAAGAVGDGRSHPLGKRFGTTLAAVAAWAKPDGTRPFAWMINPRAGLQFELETSEAQDRPGQALVFRRRLSGINDWSADVSQFNANPAEAQKLLAPGWLVTSAQGCVPPGATVATADPATGTVTLWAATVRACPAGTKLTFTIPPAMLETLEMDYVGTQGAMFAASAAGGGVVLLPPGDYRWNHSVWNPGVPGKVLLGNAELRGSGRSATRISFLTDLGPGACAVGDVNRGDGAAGYARYGGFRLIGPGRPNTSGQLVAGMDGLCIGAKAIVDDVSVGAFHAGISVLNDHGTIRNVDVGSNFYGVYFAPNSSVIGNWNILESGLGNEGWAGIGVAWNNQIDFARLSALDIGTSSPYAIYREPPPPGQTRTLGFLSNSVLEHLFAEQVGHGFINGGGAEDFVDSNVFLHVVAWLAPPPSYRIPGRPVTGMIVAQRVFGNEFIATDLSRGGAHDGVVDTAMVVARDNIQANHWGDITGALFGHAGTTPYLSAPVTLFNDFVTDRSRGNFMVTDAAVSNGRVVAVGGSLGAVRPFAPRLVVAGIAQRDAPAGTAVPVVTEGLALVSWGAENSALPGTVVTAVGQGAIADRTETGPVVGVVAGPSGPTAVGPATQVLLRLAPPTASGGR